PWLAELTRCGLAEMPTRLCVVPRSVSDRRPAGLLVIPASQHPGQARPRGIACRVIAERLYIPADAVLFPPVTDAELRALLPLPVAFFHPVFGLSAFDPQKILGATDLLAVPEERADHWNCARAGAPALPELTSVALAVPRSMQDIFFAAKGDIASEPPVDLPPAPDEPKEDPWTKSTRNLRRLLAEGVSAALRQVPQTSRTAARSGWVNDLQSWAQQQLQSIHQQLDHLRNK